MEGICLIDLGEEGQELVIRTRWKETGICGAIRAFEIAGMDCMGGRTPGQVRGGGGCLPTQKPSPCTHTRSYLYLQGTSRFFLK